MKMTKMARIGIIGGNGWLGNAIASTAVAAGAVDAAALTLSSRSDRKGNVAIPGAIWTKDNGELVRRSDAIVLSVRPEQFEGVDIDARGKLVISVMAAVSVQMIAERTGAVRIVRALPNAAAGIGKSFTPWFATPAVTSDDRAVVQRLFESCGEAEEAPREAHIDYCVGLTGSGAAFPALLSQAMIEHALSQGLPLAFARRAARGVLVNASQLLDEADDPTPIVQEVIDYRGTTAAALQVMIEKGFKVAVGAGLDAAFAKAAAVALSLAKQTEI
jgi:pyrroline-5-carboxylate reductase